MNTEQLQDLVRDLAYCLRVYRNALVNNTPIPLHVQAVINPLLNAANYAEATRVPSINDTTH